MTAPRDLVLVHSSDLHVDDGFTARTHGGDGTRGLRAVLATARHVRADAVLLAMTKNGLVPPYAPPGYQSDMPAFAGQLSDEEIWAVLAHVKSHWSQEARAARAEMLRNARRP